MKKNIKHKQYNKWNAAKVKLFIGWQSNGKNNVLCIEKVPSNLLSFQTFKSEEPKKGQFHDIFGPFIYGQKSSR